MAWRGRIFFLCFKTTEKGTYKKKDEGRAFWCGSDKKVCRMGLGRGNMRWLTLHPSLKSSSNLYWRKEYFSLKDPQDEGERRNCKKFLSRRKLSKVNPLQTREVEFGRKNGKQLYNIFIYFKIVLSDFIHASIHDCLARTVRKVREVRRTRHN